MKDALIEFGVAGLAIVVGGFAWAWLFFVAWKPIGEAFHLPPVPYISWYGFGVMFAVLLEAFARRGAK